VGEIEDRLERERRRKAGEPQLNRLHEIGPAPEEFHRRPHGPRVGRVQAGSGFPFVPLLAGVVALVVVLGFQTDFFDRWWQTVSQPPPSRQVADVNAAAIKEAEMAVPRFLKHQAVSFGDVWAETPRLACGYVNQQTLPGEPVSKRRFIFSAGVVRLDDGSAAFERDWSGRCAGGQAPLAEVAQVEPKSHGVRALRHAAR
jgi:hypothetical protein